MSTLRQQLSPTERAIVDAVLAGSSNKEIAEQLQLHIQTVKNALTNVYAKLGVCTRLQLAVFLSAKSKS